MVTIESHNKTDLIAHESCKINADITDLSNVVSCVLEFCQIMVQFSSLFQSNALHNLLCINFSFLFNKT